MYSQGHIPSLTGLRIVTAWIIFFHHINPVPDRTSFWHYLLREGHIGLTIFFVLSGFIIAKRYYEDAQSSLSFLQKYFFLRFARIYPAFWFVTTATFVMLYFLKGGISWKVYLLNITFLKGFSDFYKFTGISQTWTLTVEECFYATAPFLFLLYKTHHYFWRSLLGVYGFGLLLYRWIPPQLRFFETLHFMTHYTFFGRCFDFFAGFGLYLLLQRSQMPVLKGGLTALGVAGFGVVWLWLGYCQYGHIELNQVVLFVLQNYVLPIFIAFLIAGLVIEKTFFSQLLGLPFMQWLGNASYIFYLIHIGLLTKLLDWVDWKAYFVLINVISLLAHWFFEKPVHQYLKNKVLHHFR